MNDSELIERVRKSDVQAFKALFEKYQPLVFRQVHYQTREINLAHDIVQDTFLRIWERRGQLKPELSFVAYLFRISGNLVRDNMKYRATRRRLEGALPAPAPSETDNPEDAAQLGSLQRDLLKTVNDDLPERCRLIFLLSRLEGKSNKQISELLDIAPKTVENQLHHALKVLRRKLRDYL